MSRKQYEWQDENGRYQKGGGFRIDARKTRSLECHERRETNLEDVVVECSEKLRPEKRREASFA